MAHIRGNSAPDILKKESKMKKTVKKKTVKKLAKPAAHTAPTYSLRDAKASAKETYGALRKAVTAHKAACLVVVKALDVPTGDKRAHRNVIAGAVKDLNAFIGGNLKPTSFKQFRKAT